MYPPSHMNGGWGEIRTHGELAPTPVFKTGAINRSATHPLHHHSYQTVRIWQSRDNRTELQKKVNIFTCFECMSAVGEGLLIP